MRSEPEVNHAVEKYADMIKHVCFYHLKNHADAEDVFQNVFLKYMLHDEPFNNAEHEKAWLLRVTINSCKDYLNDFFRRNKIPLETLAEIEAEVPEEHREVLEAVLSLPAKYKDIIYLHYYEGYTSAEIAKLMKKSDGTVRGYLAKGRDLLKERLGEV